MGMKVLAVFSRDSTLTADEQLEACAYFLHLKSSSKRLDYNGIKLTQSLFWMFCESFRHPGLVRLPSKQAWNACVPI